MSSHVILHTCIVSIGRYVEGLDIKKGPKDGKKPLGSKTLTDMFLTRYREKKDTSMQKIDFGI